MGSDFDLQLWDKNYAKRTGPFNFIAVHMNAVFNTITMIATVVLNVIVLQDTRFTCGQPFAFDVVTFVLFGLVVMTVIFSLFGAICKNGAEDDSQCCAC